MASMPPPPPPPDNTWEPAASAAPPPALPWETPREPFLEAFFETVKLFVTRPSEAYSRMRTSGDLGRPILYAIALGWLGIIVGQLYSLALRGVTWHFMPGMERLQGIGMSAAFTVMMMVFAPLFVLIGLFIWSGIVHLMLLILGSAQEGFDATFRVMSYATTAQLAQVVPFCGGLVGFIWALVLEIMGIAEAHRISQGKAALAVLLPLVICCACVAAVFAVSGAAIVSAITGAAAHGR